MKSVTTNRPLRELVAEAKAEVMDEIEDDREEGEEDDPMELTAVTDLHSFFHFTPRHRQDKHSPPTTAPKRELDPFLFGRNITNE